MHRKRKKIATPQTRGAPLTLVAATYEGAAYVDLTFERAIEIAGIDVAAFVVDDGPSGFRHQGFDEPIVISPQTVRVMLNGIEEIEGSEKGVIPQTAARTAVAGLPLFRRLLPADQLVVPASSLVAPATWGGLPASWTVFARS